MRDKLRRLERRAEREAVTVPQVDGPPARFPKSVLREAFLHNLRRLGGEDVELHPFTVAVAGSQEPNRYGGTFLAGEQVVVDADGRKLAAVSRTSRSKSAQPRPVRGGAPALAKLPLLDRGAAALFFYLSK